MPVGISEEKKSALVPKVVIFFLQRCRGRRDEQDPEVQQQQQQTEQQQQAQEQPQAQASNTSVDSTKKKKTNPEKLSDSNGKLTKVRHEIIEQQNNSPGKSTGVAFVSNNSLWKVLIFTKKKIIFFPQYIPAFKTVEAASKCFDHRNLQTLKPMKIKSVARREAINWNYLHVRGGKKLAMWAISMGVFIFILLFWIIPVTAIQVGPVLFAFFFLSDDQPNKRRWVTFAISPLNLDCFGSPAFSTISALPAKVFLLSSSLPSCSLFS